MPIVVTILITVIVTIVTVLVVGVHERAKHMGLAVMKLLFYRGARQ